MGRVGSLASLSALSAVYTRTMIVGGRTTRTGAFAVTGGMLRRRCGEI